jgi:sugar O-acyltransferase (sialic acid O-acetyltransferase NeuD family)
VEKYPGIAILPGIGSPQIRQRVTEKFFAAGFQPITIIHPRAEYSTEWVEIGMGTVICAGTVITTNIKLGKQVHVNPGCTIGHDVLIGDYATLCPGANISGHVEIGKRVFVGAGAVILNGNWESPIVIGDDVVVGAGACVTKSVAAGLTVAGVPARPLHVREDKIQ